MEDQYPRQHHVTLASALGDAVRNFRSQSAAYRNPHGELARRMDKAVRKGLAASMDDAARVLEDHARELGIKLA